MRPSVPLILAALLSASAISGCGLKNDLYLPEEPAHQTDQDEQTKDEESS
ncbi:MAG: lipoprotein [Wenzhouxiangella sp.]|jgi:predicted small lipoprotein YifL|nr:lipoprotein [Wenzhouxiangella sp.]